MAVGEVLQRILVRDGRLVALLVMAAAATIAAPPSEALAVDGAHTTTSLTGTPASPQAMTGTITLSDAAPATTYVLVDSFRAMPARDAGPRRLYTGTYRFTFTGCAGGTAIDDGPEVVSAGDAQPDRPPASSGAPTFTTLPASTSMRCDYRVAFSGHAPSGAIDSVRADLWVLQDGSPVARFAGPAVPAPFPPPVAVPESPYASMLPAAALVLFGLALLLLPRRSEGSGPGGAA